MTLNWSDILVQGGLITICFGGMGFMFKRWMDARENTEANIIAEHQKSFGEITKEIKCNRQFYERTYFDLSKKIDTVADLQRIANGKVGKLDIRLTKLQQAHEDRTGKHERSTDCIGV